MLDLSLEMRVRSQSLGQDSTLSVLNHATLYWKHLSLLPALLPFFPFSSSSQGDGNALVAKVLEKSETRSMLLELYL